MNSPPRHLDRLTLVAVIPACMRCAGRCYHRITRPMIPSCCTMSASAGPALGPASKARGRGVSSAMTSRRRICTAATARVSAQAVTMRSRRATIPDSVSSRCRPISARSIAVRPRGQVSSRRSKSSRRSVRRDSRTGIRRQRSPGFRGRTATFARSTHPGIPRPLRGIRHGTRRHVIRRSIRSRPHAENSRPRERGARKRR